MPYHIASDNEDCDGFAVVKNGTNRVLGCHKTKSGASRQLAALLLSESDVVNTFTQLVDNATIEVQKTVDLVRERLLNDGEL